MCVTFEDYPGSWYRREFPWQLVGESYEVPPSIHAPVFGLHKSKAELKSEVKETVGLHFNVISFWGMHWSL